MSAIDLLIVVAVVASSRSSSGCLVGRAGGRKGPAAPSSGPASAGVAEPGHVAAEQRSEPGKPRGGDIDTAVLERPESVSRTDGPAARAAGRIPVDPGPRPARRCSPANTSTRRTGTTSRRPCIASDLGVDATREIVEPAAHAACGRGRA